MINPSDKSVMIMLFQIALIITNKLFYNLRNFTNDAPVALESQDDMTSSIQLRMGIYSLEQSRSRTLEKQAKGVLPINGANQVVSSSQLKEPESCSIYAACLDLGGDIRIPPFHLDTKCFEAPSYFRTDCFCKINFVKEYEYHGSSESIC